ncbi:LlaJI family restriction endonuclease [Aeromonas veronii]|uniref:LlaJI family restriction endonuclease n=1 Tax=Aeromonas veronii TaxID=654 RepID=UPI003D1F0026
MNIIIHEDRSPVHKLPAHIRKVLDAERLLNADQEKLDFCGMVLSGERADVFLPRKSDFSASKEPRVLASSLIRAIHKYTLNRNRTSLTGGVDEQIIGGSILGLAFTLLSDYLTYGLYIRRYADIRKNAGKTDWKRTIGGVQGYPSLGSLVYLDTIGKKSMTWLDDEITRIHASVIREINQIIGWVFFDVDTSISSDLAEIQYPNDDKEKQIVLLEKELITLYADRDIKLMQNLSAFLSYKNGKSGGDLVIGINKFHVMWEHMINACMEWTFDINNKLAKPCYKINDELLMATQKGGRTDTVLRSVDKSKFAIIDAKYYGADNISNLPGWPDLIKQFFYASALKDLYPDAKIYNYFIFPGVLRKAVSAHLQDPVSRELRDANYPPIECIYLEPMTLIKNYISGGKLLNLSMQLLHIDN